MITRKLLYSVSLLGSILLTFLLHHSLSLPEWMDLLFLIGLIFLVICAILILIEVDFFGAFINSFRHFFSRINKKEQVIRESEKRSTDSVVYRKSFPSRKIFLETGMLFCAFSLIVSTLIYYFGR